ncbi:GNAT family N-acetyltransferase [Saliphagus infecundisoli]|uniref:GNAT family N-acetyltransferase n=1 Tax=Saliphagus infecundisoli TaxID=1849069 RepID=A0ABD5QAU5_9EURY|nr:GNAT family N-acetyltransferase [Saliphagus infecundisoli]
MTDPTIRTATPEDVTGIRHVAERSWNAAYNGILDGETIDCALEEWYDPDQVREFVDRDEVTYLVAEDGDVVGYASGGPDGEGEGDVAVLGAIYADPDLWGEGIGTALLSAFERERRRAGDDAVRLRVLADNEVGIAFYRARGYEPVAEREDELFGERVAERVFRRALE